MLRFPAKKLRARVIREFMTTSGHGDHVVCFSCGNAAQALRDEGLDVLEIGPRGQLSTDCWWTHSDIRRAFPDRFDATSGHLQVGLMRHVGALFRHSLGELGPGPFDVPSGSGETLVCLKLAYPKTEFVAVYGLDEATRYEKQAPLNRLVQLLGDVVMSNCTMEPQ